MQQRQPWLPSACNLCKYRWTLYNYSCQTGFTGNGRLCQGNKSPRSILLVFSVTPFKIDQNKNQNRSIDKVQNLGNRKEVNIQRLLAKIQARGIFRIRDIRRNVFTKLIEVCMETPCWCPSWWASTWRTETNSNICYWFCLKIVNLFFEELLKQLVCHLHGKLFVIHRW